jgi:hypothetical protein
VDDSEPEPYVTLPVEVVDLLDGVAAADDVERCSMLVDDDSLYTALVDREDASSLLVEEEVALPLDADGLESYRFNSRPALTGGASGDPDGGASPSFAGLENGVTVFVHAVGARVGGQRLAVVGVQYRTGRAHPGTPQVAVYPHRPEVALTREMLKWLHVATSVPVAFAMEATWLSKGLLQRERRFGAPILFSLVLELHEKARGLEHPVFVVGGVEVPHALARAVHATIDDLQRQAA